MAGCITHCSPQLLHPHLSLQVRLPVDPWEELLGSHAGRSPSISLPLSPRQPSVSLGGKSQMHWHR